MMVDEKLNDKRYCGKLLFYLKNNLRCRIKKNGDRKNLKHKMYEIILNIIFCFANEEF